MTCSFLLAFCHLRIILHLLSRSSPPPPLPASIVSSFPPPSFNPSFILSPSLPAFLLTPPFFFFSQPPTSFCFFHSPPRLHLFSCVFFLVSICSSPSFCNIRRREEFHLRNTSATFVFSLVKKKKRSVILTPMVIPIPIRFIFCVHSALDLQFLIIFALIMLNKNSFGYLFKFYLNIKVLYFLSISVRFKGNVII